MREYAVIYEIGPGSWGTYVPYIPGLVAAGNTLEEVQAPIKEGLELHLESMLEDGDPIPAAKSLVGTIKTDIVETWSPHLTKSA
jgi:predicted RNase H-like HicB family nuclease